LLTYLGSMGCILSIALSVCFFHLCFVRDLIEQTTGPRSVPVGIQQYTLSILGKYLIITLLIFHLARSLTLG